MARPKSEDKKLALLDAATSAFAQSGIAASTALIARSAGVAEGTLFRYFATKDDLLNALYLHLKQDLCQTMLANMDRALTQPKEHTRNIWNSYVDWGIRNPMAHGAIRQLGVSEKINAETEQAVHEMFPELHELCRRHKKHWISVYAAEDITPELIADLVNDSWHLVVDKLPKKEQKRLRPGG